VLIRPPGLVSERVFLSVRSLGTLVTTIGKEVGTHRQTDQNLDPGRHPGIPAKQFRIAIEKYLVVRRGGPRPSGATLPNNIPV
jgi:hypothetical protein